MSRGSFQNWEYRDSAVEKVPSEVPQPAPPPAPAPVRPGFSEEEVALRIQAKMADAEKQWAARAAGQEVERQARLRSTLDHFAKERARYFREVEGEVVQLALAVCRKILQREASIDPELVQALIRIALDRMSAGETITLRVPPSELTSWQERGFLAETRYTCTIIPDGALDSGDCIVKTDLGSANFSIAAQLKEIEGSMLDLLQLRPIDSQEQKTSAHSVVGGAG